MIRYHYAVWKKSSYPYMDPACVTFRVDLAFQSVVDHGLTRNRGKVNCPDCMRMMGMS